MVAGCASPQADSGNGTAFPPVPVTIGQAVEESVPIQIRAVGTAEPYATVDVKSQVAGSLLSVKFTEGATVNQGDLLFEIDPRPFREALRQAEAGVAKDGAQLRVAEAKIESVRAALESDRAAVEQAKLSLSFCEIHAPISGRAGNLLLHPGNLVKANGDNALVVLNQIKPIFVSFGVPERYLTAVAQQHSRHKLVVDANPDKDSTHMAGTLAVIDNAVDANTGTIRLKAAFDNKQFVNVVITVDTQTATVIPSEAVQVGQQGSFVYVVKTDQTVEPRPVAVGQTVSNKVIIEKGVTSGETIVTDGQSRAQPGAAEKRAGRGRPI